MGHQHSKRQKMQPSQGLRQAFVVTGEATKARYPAKAALDDLTTGQEHKAFLGLRQLDHLQTYTLFGGSSHGVVARVALVDKGHLDGLAGRFLDCLGQLLDLSAVLFARSCSSAAVTSRASKCPNVSTARCVLLPLRRLAPS